VQRLDVLQVLVGARRHAEELDAQTRALQQRQHVAQLADQLRRAAQRVVGELQHHVALGHAFGADVVEIQLCGSRGPVSTRWPGSKWPM